MNTVVTGGAGFIGSNLVRKLLDQGRMVTIADDFSRGAIQNLIDLNIKPNNLGQKSNFLKVDLKDYKQACKAIQGAESVFHLAARIGSINYLHGSNTKELEALLTNLVIDANVFKACHENGIKKLIYASSVAVYPIDIQNTSYSVVMSEDGLTCNKPEGGYGWAKLMGEIELQLMSGIDTGVARIFNIYGKNSHVGENPHVVIDLMRKTMLHPKEPLIVWGNGKQFRDFLHVSDCVEALLKLEEKASSPAVIVNIGSGVPTSIGTIAEKVVALSGKDIKIIYDHGKPVGPLSRTADISKARVLLSWYPAITLDDGLRLTYNWLKKKSQVI